jgi:hypothetical protein
MDLNIRTYAFATMTGACAFISSAIIYYMVSVDHYGGFFSCSSCRLDKIIRFYEGNEVAQAPRIVDTSRTFTMYKCNDNDDVTFDFFKHYDNQGDISLKHQIHIDSWAHQFQNYKQVVDYDAVSPFIWKYFSPSEKVCNKIDELCQKYRIDFDNCIAIYNRGTDKQIETALDSYDSYLRKLNEVMPNRDVQVLIQSDDGHFVNYMRENCRDKNLIVISENPVIYTSAGVHNEHPREQNHHEMYYLLATFIIISKCKNIMCSSSNGALWIMYYRGHANNVSQSLHRQWI